MKYQFIGQFYYKRRWMKNPAYKFTFFFLNTRIIYCRPCLTNHHGAKKTDKAVQFKTGRLCLTTVTNAHTCCCSGVAPAAPAAPARLLLGAPANRSPGSLRGWRGVTSRTAPTLLSAKTKERNVVFF